MEFIERIETENTGGNVMIDFLYMKDGKFVAISEDGIGMYESKESFENGDEPLSYIER